MHVSNVCRPARQVTGAWTEQVCEQTLKALGMEVCGDLVANRGLIAALFSPVATDSFLSAGLGLGRTVHGEAAKEGEISRKGISCERTFAAISSTGELEAKVSRGSMCVVVALFVFVSPDCCITSPDMCRPIS